MNKRRKPGRKSTGLTVTKSFTLTPKANRELVKTARDFGSEANVIRAALDAFFLARNVRSMDSVVQSFGQELQEAVAV